MDYKQAAYTLRMMKRTAFPSADEREAIDLAVSVLETLPQENNHSTEFDINQLNECIEKATAEWGGQAGYDEWYRLVKGNGTTISTKEKIAVMQAFIEGAEIEFQTPECPKWETIDEPIWNWDNYTYRVKPT